MPTSVSIRVHPWFTVPSVPNLDTLQNLVLQLHQTRFQWRQICAKIAPFLRDRSRANMNQIWENQIETPDFMRAVRSRYAHNWRGKLRAIRKDFMALADEPEPLSPFRLLRKPQRGTGHTVHETPGIVQIVLRGNEDGEQIEAALASVLSVARRLGLDYAVIVGRALARVRGMAGNVRLDRQEEAR